MLSRTDPDNPIGPRRPASAMPGWLLFPALILLIIAVDQSSKILVVSRLDLYQTYQPIPALSHLFTFTFITNSGAAFGLFPDNSLIFAGIAILVAAAIILYFRRIPRGEWLLRTSLAMQLGGALGNLIDRVRLGYVIDFVDFRAWPVFNFADTFIVVGVLLLAYRLLLHPEPYGQRPPDTMAGS